MWQNTEGERGFVVAYRTVFAPSGRMNPVSRQQRKQLIQLANLCAEKYERNDVYGNVQTGTVNADKITELYNLIINKCL